jgi:hypothetical protein
VGEKGKRLKSNQEINKQTVLVSETGKEATDK